MDSIPGQLNPARDMLAAPEVASANANWRDFLELGKARLSAMVVFTTAVGFALGSVGEFDWPRLLITVVGTSLAALGANAFNQIVEVRRDAAMRRTRERPLPAGRLTVPAALTFASITGICGPALLALATNALAGALAAICLALYVIVYTPMKVRSPFNTIVGAVCGAIPPLIGFAAAANELTLAAWALGSVLFVWQIPHFLALAWLYREDYARGGFQMLPLRDPSGRVTSQQAVIYSLALVPAALLITGVGAAGSIFALGAVLLGLGLAWLAVGFYRVPSSATARRLFLASIVYLPILLGLLMIDRRSSGL